MGKQKVYIEEYYDGFAIFVKNSDDESTVSFTFNQEDTMSKMKELFTFLEYDASYELVY